MKFDADWWKRAAEHLSNEKVELQAELAAVREENERLKVQMSKLANTIRVVEQTSINAGRKINAADAALAGLQKKYDRLKANYDRWYAQFPLVELQAQLAAMREDAARIVILIESGEVPAAREIAKRLATAAPGEAHDAPPTKTNPTS